MKNWKLDNPLLDVYDFYVKTDQILKETKKC